MDVRRPDSRPLRLATIAIIALALVGTKASGALAALLPEGARTVVLCTGTGLVRVALSADGAVVDSDVDGAPLEHGGHCDLTAFARADVERRWATIGRTRTTASTGVAAARVAPAPRARAPRDPPPRAPPVPA